jgi:hypothetical protein
LDRYAGRASGRRATRDARIPQDGLGEASWTEDPPGEERPSWWKRFFGFQ